MSKPDLGMCLVTGASGFFGRPVVRQLLEAGWRVCTWGGPGDAATGERIDLHFEGDITDPCIASNAVRGADCVVHLAGPPSVAESFRDPVEYARIHVLGTARIVEAALAARVRRFVYISSAEVYGCDAPSPVRETSELRPRSPYGAAKAGGELYVTAAMSRGLSPVVLRPFSLFGHGSCDRGVFATIMKQADGSERIELEDLSLVRDFCFVEDAAEAVVRACSVDATGVAINVGTGLGTSIEDLAHAIVAARGRRRIPIVQRPGDRERPNTVSPRELVADVTRGEQILSWHAHTSLVVGIERTLRSIRSQTA